MSDKATGDDELEQLLPQYEQPKQRYSGGIWVGERQVHYVDIEKARSDYELRNHERQLCKQAIRTKYISRADLLHTLDDISNKPWRAMRHIREMYQDSPKADTTWFKEVARDYALLEEFMSNGGMNKVRQLMADPEFNVNYPERIPELRRELGLDGGE